MTNKAIFHPASGDYLTPEEASKLIMSALMRVSKKKREATSKSIY